MNFLAFINESSSDSRIKRLTKKLDSLSKDSSRRVEFTRNKDSDFCCTVYNKFDDSYVAEFGGLSSKKDEDIIDSISELLESEEHESEVSSGNYKREITEDNAKSILQKKCKNMDFSLPYFRGMSVGKDFYILEGASGSRKSKNTTNYYTHIIDNNLKSESSSYPLRSRSIICANNPNKGTAMHFGSGIYAIFPYDDVTIGSTQFDDLWFSYVTIGGVTRRIFEWNDLYKQAGINSDSIYEIIENIEDIFDIDEDRLNSHQRDLVDAFTLKKNVRTFIEKAYSSKSLKFVFGKTSKINKIKDPVELWFGGECIAIEYHTWMNMKRDGFVI